MRFPSAISKPAPPVMKNMSNPLRASNDSSLLLSIANSQKPASFHVASIVPQVYHMPATCGDIKRNNIFLCLVSGATKIFQTGLTGLTGLWCYLTQRRRGRRDVLYRGVLIDVVCSVSVRDKVEGGNLQIAYVVIRISILCDDRKVINYIP